LRKGIAHTPLTDQAIDEAARSSLLKAVIEAIVEGRVPDNLTVTGLVRNLPAEWPEPRKPVSPSEKLTSGRPPTGKRGQNAIPVLDAPPIAQRRRGSRSS
jgi:hypothetical protein